MFTDVQVLRPASVQENRVTPDAILDYRISHKLRCPSCLCAASDIDTAYTESAIYKSTHGTYSGEYLVACAAGRCGYLSRSNAVYINHI